MYRGRLAASDQVTSPSGVVCAFYEAELRGVTPGGGKGSLLSVERASAPVVRMRGEKTEAALSFSPGLVLAPLRVRPCLVGRPAEVAPGLDAPVEGAPPEEALSYERVGKLGEECLVVGELRPGPVAGGYELRGRQGGPAMVILGEAAEGTGTHGAPGLEAVRRGGGAHRGRRLGARGLSGAPSDIVGCAPRLAMRHHPGRQRSGLGREECNR
ncbi:hypothetical protein ACN28S_26335 [Cystobacter fuscus]